MKKNNLHKQAFTLIEVLISMTIFVMIMVSASMIYATISEMSYKADITREMQQNIKSVVEDIAEEVRKNDII
jgi:prepilin-type N-terminal cleavage/methylation domain-containing protein